MGKEKVQLSDEVLNRLKELTPKNSFESLLNADDLNLAKFLGLFLLFLLPYSFAYFSFPDILAPENVYIFILYSLGMAGAFSILPLIFQIARESKLVSFAIYVIDEVTQISKAYDKTLTTEQKKSLDTSIAILNDVKKFDSPRLILRTVSIVWVGSFIPALIVILNLYALNPVGYMKSVIAITFLLSVFSYVRTQQEINKLKTQLLIPSARDVDKTKKTLL